MHKNKAQVIGAVSISTALIAIGLTGIGLEGQQLSGWYVIFELGRTLLIISAVLGVGAFTSRHSTSMDEAFDAGRRCGYREGRRANSLRSVRPLRDYDEAVG